MRANSFDPIVIVGAGIVGACVAAWLARDGRKVKLIDMRGPGEGASFGNAGALNASSIVPLGLPGGWRRLPRGLIGPRGPLSIRPSYLPRLAKWLWHFKAASSPDRVGQITQALRPLLRDALSNYQVLTDAAGASHLVERRGTLYVYAGDAAYRADAWPMRLRAEAGVALTELDRRALHAIEPALSARFSRGRLIEENGHCTDPAQLTRMIAQHATAQGGAVVIDRVIGFDFDGAGGVAAVRCQGSVHRASAVVLAAGAWSAPLAAQLGDPLPLDTERGYHVTINQPEVTLRMPAIWPAAGLAATPMQMGLRLAGMVEFAGLDAAPDWAHTEHQLRLGQQMYPTLARSYPSERVSRWMGFRPSMPDSLPVIGRATVARNAFYAFGHGHIGLVAGATTGRIIADLIAGRAPCIAIEPFSPTRFGRAEQPTHHRPVGTLQARA